MENTLRPGKSKPEHLGSFDKVARVVLLGVSVATSADVRGLVELEVIFDFRERGAVSSHLASDTCFQSS